MREASEEEDPLDPLSDAIFHPKPRGLILLCRRFVEMETLFLWKYLIILKYFDTVS